MNKKSLKLIHHKDLHNVQLQGLRVKERCIFMALCFKAMEQESNLIEFNISELKKLIHYRNKNEDGDIYTYLDNTYISLQNITIRVNKNNGFKRFVLFTMFETFEDTGFVHFKINEEYKYLLNSVVAPYTIQNLLEYNNLSSKYSQLLYSILKQWDKKKEVILTIEDFKECLGIPENYRMCIIDTRVLTPIKKELSQYFLNLKIEKIKTGRKVTSIKFSWTEKEKKKKENLPLITYLENEEKDGTGMIASRCRELHGIHCTGGHQKIVVCQLCNLMNKSKV